MLDLATCVFITRRQNALLLGPTGVGKSHIAQAIGHRACRAGHSVLYTPAQDLLKQLRAARGDGTYDRRLLRYTSPDLLIIDDLGLRPLKGDEPMDLYEIIRVRYERGSTVITSNRSDSELGDLFGDPLLTSAAMDRLLHDAHVVILDGESFRNPRSPRRSRNRTPLRRRHHEHDNAETGSAWPIRSALADAADRALHAHRVHWIRLADLCWIQKGDR